MSEAQLELAFSQDERTQAPLSLSISESYSYDSEKLDGRLYAFGLLVTNQSDIPNSVVRVELLIDYEVQDRQVLTAVFQHDEGLSDEDTRALNLPISLGPRGSEVGWALFHVHPDLRIDHRIRGHRISLTDSHGVQSEAWEILVREVLDAGPQDDG